MWVGHRVNCRKSVHRINIRLLIEPMKCLVNGTILQGPPNGYHALNTSRPTLIADFYFFFQANLV